MKKHNVYFALMALGVLFCSCSNKIRIAPGNAVYRWQNNTPAGLPDTREVLTNLEAVTGTITLKTDYIVIKADSGAFKKMDNLTKQIQIPPGFRTDEIGNLIFPETKYAADGVPSAFHYSDWKRGIQALTIPFKFRGALSNRTLFPPQLETGVNLGFAAGIKREWNTYRVSKNFWGNNITTFSITAGPMIGGSGVDLKGTTNAPGLVGDRKAFAISYGGYVMFGIGNISLGYAIGTDRITGPAHNNWVYNGKAWQGIIVALDVLKF